MKLSSMRRFAPHVILFLAFTLRLVNLTGESLWRDEVDTIRFAFEPLGNILANFTATGFNGPLYHLLVRGWLSLGGVNDFALRYLSLTCGVVLVALIYTLGKRMFNERAALIAMWFAAIAPILIWYAGEGKMYSLQPMLLTLALYALLKATSDCRLLEGNDKSKTWWAVFIIAASLSFYVQLLSPLFLPVAALFFFALWPHSRKRMIRGLIALALLTLPYVPLAIWQVPEFLRGGNIGHTFYPLDQMALTLASNWTLGLDGRAPFLNLSATDGLVTFVRLGLLTFVAAIVLFGLIETARRAQDCADEQVRFRLQLATLGWLTLPALSVFIISTRLPIFQPRYMLWSAPALCLLVGVGLARLIEQGRVGRLAQAASLAALSFVSVSGLTSQIINPIRPDLRSAVRFVTQNMQPQDVVVFQIPYARYSFAYYAERFGRPLNQMQIVEAPYTNNGMTVDKVGRAMQENVAPARRVWSFETEVAMWDAQGLVRAWMDEKLNLAERRELRGVSVGLYEAP